MWWIKHLMRVFTRDNVRRKKSLPIMTWKPIIGPTLCGALQLYANDYVTRHPNFCVWRLVSNNWLHVNKGNDRQSNPYFMAKTTFMFMLDGNYCVCSQNKLVWYGKTYNYILWQALVTIFNLSTYCICSVINTLYNKQEYENKILYFQSFLLITTNKHWKHLTISLNYISPLI